MDIGASSVLKLHSNSLADDFSTVQKFIIRTEETISEQEKLDDRLTSDKLTLERFFLGLGIVSVMLFSSSMWALATPLPPVTLGVVECYTSHLPFHLCLLAGTLLGIIIVVSLYAMLDDNRVLLTVASLLLLVFLVLVSTMATAITECSRIQQQQTMYDSEICQEMRRRYIFIAVLSALSSVGQIAAVVRIGMTLKVREFTLPHLSRRTYLLTYIPVKT